MVRQEFEVIEERPGREPEPEDMTREERVARLVALGQALSDPIRVRMLGLMAAAAREGRGCCGLPNLGAPVDTGEEIIGVCVCEFEDFFGMGQSKVSYHVRKLKEAGLIREEKRSKWSFYSLDQGAVQELLHETAVHLGSGEAS
ncbi:MAG TPA: metalloregulator ArsR/SmtB family transcription factor [Rubrobacteraceae bacterium]|nr:metalloregulator ArsR/SmtB family transcription factor [Rubrobacteraceae bacterium]